MEVCVVIICVIILKLAAELPVVRARKKIRYHFLDLLRGCGGFINTLNIKILLPYVPTHQILNFLACPHPNPSYPSPFSIIPHPLRLTPITLHSLLSTTPLVHFTPHDTPATKQAASQDALTPVSGAPAGRKAGRRCCTWAGCPTPSRWQTTAPHPHRARRLSTPTQQGASLH